MSKQVRMACVLLDMLRTEPTVTTAKALERIEYDDNSIRQTLKVLADLGWAELRGVDADGLTKLYVAGPKMRGGV